jgi:hypothetical protein
MAANPPQAPVAFARTPAFATDRGVINYNSREGSTTFYKNVRGYYGLTDSDKFNAQPEGLKNFLEELMQRIDEADWMDLFMIPVDNNAPDDDALFFPKAYGMFSLAQLTEYLEIHHVNQQDRWEQDNIQAQMSIMNSLSKDAKHRIGVWSDDYTIEGEIFAVLLLKVIIRESRGDTNHRKLVLRQQLSSLDTKIEDLGWSITQLHTHVKDVLDDLTALGQETHDLLANLFKAYARVPDDEFVSYMNTKRQNYDEGTNYTPAQIMVYAGDKYKQRVEDKSWTAPSKEQQQIVTMQAKLDKLEKKGTTSSKSTTTTNKTTNAGPQRAEWQMVKPTNKEITAGYTKKVNGKVFKWCDKHGFWAKHSTEQCRLPEKKEEAATTASKVKKGVATSKNDAKKAKLTQALAAIHDDHEVSEDDDDEDDDE